MNDLNFRYNEITLIKDLVEKELIKYLQEIESKVPVNIWYKKHRSEFETLTTWQKTTNQLSILGSIYHRCLCYEETCRKTLINK